jgi:hypothetical protein
MKQASVSSVIEGIFSAAGPALSSVHASMVNNQNTDSFPPQSQQPILHRQPGMAGSLAARGHKRREVVQNKKVHAVQMRLKSLLPSMLQRLIPTSLLSAARIMQPIIRHINTKPRQYRIQSHLKVGQGHLSIRDNNTTRTGRFPLQKRATARDSHANRRQS